MDAPHVGQIPRPEGMGQELGDLFAALSQELVFIRVRWNQYRILFCNDPASIGPLNLTASSFFNMVQDLIFEDTVLAIARLVGKDTSCGYDVLSIESLTRLVNENRRGEMASRVKDAQDAAAFTMEWRHRRIAHRDLGLALKRTNAMPLPEITRAQVEDALSTLDEVLNFVQEHYNGARTVYSSAHFSGDASDLLYIIRSGLDREREQLHPTSVEKVKFAP
jgi:hypothetical protein